MMEVKEHHQYDVVGYACAVTATLFTALNMVVMRKCKDVHFSLVVLQLSVWALVVAVILLVVLRPHVTLPHGWQQWTLVAAVSGFGLAGQVLLLYLHVPLNYAPNSLPTYLIIFPICFNTFVEVHETALTSLLVFIVRTRAQCSFSLKRQAKIKN
ncbi:hypothetical protein PR048_020740 [Dryococelus australis]|uniref:Uncharacterized protein n=1 Tax=Dryococelus australis TaxID=614101 RepID=A0ABQ9H762_9NEOP|nr:hypothetical protein PR048_020740 [Dryococelus australis]